MVFKLGHLTVQSGKMRSCAARRRPAALMRQRCGSSAWPRRETQGVVCAAHSWLLPPQPQLLLRALAAYFCFISLFLSLSRLGKRLFFFTLPPLRLEGSSDTIFISNLLSAIRSMLLLVGVLFQDTFTYVHGTSRRLLFSLSGVTKLGRPKNGLCLVSSTFMIIESAYVRKVTFGAR